jgi:hypothetical protein
LVDEGGKSVSPVLSRSVAWATVRDSETDDGVCLK